MTSVETSRVARAAGKLVRWVVLLSLLLGMATLAAAQASRRLILTDGSWQAISDYRVVGDRVQYLVPTRKSWEEVPASLVDWKATREWNKQFAQPAPALETRSTAGSDADEGLSAAPGLELPSRGGIFLLDTFSGQPSLVELNQVRGVLQHSTAGFFRFPTEPGTSTKDRLQLKGAHARTQSHVAAPLLFVKISSSGEAKPVPEADRYRIARLDVDLDARIFGRGKLAASGEQGAAGPFVAARVTAVGHGWVQIAPAENLEQGEYALVEILPGNRINSYVWDFGVDPNAPDNINSRKPYSVVGAGQLPGGKSPPELERR